MGDLDRFGCDECFEIRELYCCERCDALICTRNVSTCTGNLNTLIRFTCCDGLQRSVPRRNPKAERRAEI